MKKSSSKNLGDEWACHCCSARNVAESEKCRVCGRPESYALQGYGMPFHGKNSTLFRPTQILTVLEDIHEVDSELWSALHSACASGNYPVVRDLLSYKAKVEAVTNKGQTPLHLAVYSGSLDCVNELIKFGADVNVFTTHERCTPLHMACQKGFAQIVVALVDANANVEALNILNRTPLHMAAECGRIDIGKYLLMHGSKRDALDVHGWSCRQVAELNNHREFQELMIREGMVEKQIIIKELPVAEWHSDLWFDVSRMHAQRTAEVQQQAETRKHDYELVLSLQRSKKDKIVAQRRAERQLEIQQYNVVKNHAKEMALQYQEILIGGKKRTGSASESDSKPSTTMTVQSEHMQLTPAVSRPSTNSVKFQPFIGEPILRINTAEKIRYGSSSGMNSRASTSEGSLVGGDIISKPASRIGSAGMAAISNNY